VFIKELGTAALPSLHIKTYSTSHYGDKKTLDNFLIRRKGFFWFMISEFSAQSFLDCLAFKPVARKYHITGNE
jgi:hypothetical protein